MQREKKIKREREREREVREKEIRHRIGYVFLNNKFLCKLNRKQNKNHQEALATRKAIDCNKGSTYLGIS
jgi:hypothetical protein